MMFSLGSQIAFFQGDVLKLFEDIQVLKPSIFVSVPRLFNKLYDKINQAVEELPAHKRMIFDLAFSSKKAKLDQGLNPEGVVADFMVFNKFKARLGGNVKVMVTGSAPISKHVFQFLQVCFGCPVLQGYGLTETSAAVSVMQLNDYSSANCGLPVSCCEVKLEDVAEMHYLVSNNQGEICVRGPNISQGYYKDPTKTKEAFDEDGWFHTGDIGKWNENGSLSIIDRKKNIFKLSQGEYVAAEHIEAIYSRCKYVGQIFVYGDSFQSVLVAIIVPAEELLKNWAKEQKIETTDFSALCKLEQVKKFILGELTATGKLGQLRGFEFVKAIHVESTLFSIDNNLLTPTFKLKRADLQKRYQTDINTMYSTLAASQSGGS